MNIQALHELHSLYQSLVIGPEVCIEVNGEKIHHDLELILTMPIFELVRVIFIYCLSYCTF